MDAKKVYEALLGLYPRDYRDRFAQEMLDAFEEALEQRRQRGYARFVLAELAGLFIGAGFEWIAKITADPAVRGRSLPDRLLTRPPGVSWEAHYGPSASMIPEEVRAAEQHVDLLVQRMVYAISHHDFERARQYSNQEREAREHARLLRRRFHLAE